MFLCSVTMSQSVTSRMQPEMVRTGGDSRFWMTCKALAFSSQNRKCMLLFCRCSLKSDIYLWKQSSNCSRSAEKHYRTVVLLPCMSKLWGVSQSWRCEYYIFLDTLQQEEAMWQVLLVPCSQKGCSIKHSSITSTRHKPCPTMCRRSASLHMSPGRCHTSLATNR